jgi:hypothetical protein
MCAITPALIRGAVLAMSKAGFIDQAGETWPKGSTVPRGKLRVWGVTERGLAAIADAPSYIATGARRPNHHHQYRWRRPPTNQTMASALAAWAQDGAASYQDVFKRTGLQRGEMFSLVHRGLVAFLRTRQINGKRAKHWTITDLGRQELARCNTGQLTDLPPKELRVQFELANEKRARESEEKAQRISEIRAANYAKANAALAIQLGQKDARQ